MIKHLPGPLARLHEAYLTLDDEARLRAYAGPAVEEVSGRPSVHRLVRQLATAAPPTLRRHAEQFAAQIGVTR